MSHPENPIKECTLNHNIKAPVMPYNLRYIPELRFIGFSGYFGGSSQQLAAWNFAKKDHTQQSQPCNQHQAVSPKP